MSALPGVRAVLGRGLRALAGLFRRPAPPPRLQIDILPPAGKVLRFPRINHRDVAMGFRPTVSDDQDQRRRVVARGEPAPLRPWGSNPAKSD